MLHDYDATQEKCPLPLVKMRLMLKKMHKGDTCKIRIADHGSKKDIPKYLHKMGYIFYEKIVDNTIVELFIENR